jgi:hypothetical protein
MQAFLIRSGCLDESAKWRESSTVVLRLLFWTGNVLSFGKLNANVRITFLRSDLANDVYRSLLLVRRLLNVAPPAGYQLTYSQGGFPAVVRHVN